MKKLVTEFYGDNGKYVVDPKTARQKAMEAMMAYGRILVEKGMAHEYGVSVAPIRNKVGRPWGLFVESYDNETVSPEKATPVY